MQIRTSTLVWSAAGLLAVGTATGLATPALLQTKDSPPVTAAESPHPIPQISTPNYRAIVAENQPRAGSDQAGLQHGIRHAGHCLHRLDGMPDRRRGDILLTQRANRSKLAKILECVDLALWDQFRALPPL